MEQQNFNNMDQQETQDFIKRINQASGLSQYLLDIAKPLEVFPSWVYREQPEADTEEGIKPLWSSDKADNLDWAMEKLKIFHDYILFIEKLAWIEHTCDWDLLIIVELADGTTWNSEHGYADFRVEGNTVYFQSAEDQDDQIHVEIEYPITITDIKSLRLRS